MLLNLNLNLNQNTWMCLKKNTYSF